MKFYLLVADLEIVVFLWLHSSGQTWWQSFPVMTYRRCSIPTIWHDHIFSSWKGGHERKMNLGQLLYLIVHEINFGQMFILNSSFWSPPLYLDIPMHFYQSRNRWTWRSKDRQLCGSQISGTLRFWRFWINEDFSDVVHTWQQIRNKKKIWLFGQAVINMTSPCVTLRTWLSEKLENAAVKKWKIEVKNDFSTFCSPELNQLTSIIQQTPAHSDDPQFIMKRFLDSWFKMQQNLFLSLWMTSFDNFTCCCFS